MHYRHNLNCHQIFKLRVNAFCRLFNRVTVISKMARQTRAYNRQPKSKHGDTKGTCVVAKVQRVGVYMTYIIMM